MRNDMKTRVTIIALGALLVVAGCSREDQNPEPKTVRLSARVESDATRSTVDGTTGAWAWDTGDQIAVHSDNAFISKELSSDGSFTLTAAQNAARNGYAVYPASVKLDAYTGIGSAALKVNLPASYAVTASTSVRTPLPMVALNDAGSDFLFFRHVGALIRIEGLAFPSGTTSATVTFNKGVHGVFEVTTGSAPTIFNTTAEGGNNSVTFTFSGTPLPTTLNIPVPCGTYQGVTVTGNTGGYSVEIDGLFSLERHQGTKLSAPEP